ncbi:P-loop containing nucleoside triphosphate hydrolase protein [Annulohypoxylon moriforme]|nr:P-loop containing nucleoside triphosphate hydrolase protein [Annulohypoxylon moriforme]
MKVNQIRYAFLQDFPIHGFSPIYLVNSHVTIYKLRVTLAQQGVDNIVATISYSKRFKLKNIHSKLRDKSLPIEWESCDEEFLDMTVIHDPEAADMDICAVHGLNGNAFDTWVCEENGEMWLRDLLPRIESFAKSRMMIFGYSSELRGNEKADDRDYADSLLQQLKSTRDCLQDKSRPLIIIAHSMGGLVSRLAMSRLQSLPRKFSRVPVLLSQCGLLFLSTPHYGSKSADWDAFWVRLGKLAAGLRTEIIDYLKTFSLSIIEVMDIWNEMTKKPVIRCLCEADKTAIRYLNSAVEVVSPVSAGFLDQTAEKVLRTDHHTICKFKGIHETPFQRVKDNLEFIQGELIRRKTEELCINRSIAKQIEDIPLEPRRTPLSTTRTYFYLGHQASRNPRQLIGQSKVTDEIYDYLQGSSERRFVCLHGIGGSGKTEITYEVARRHKDYQTVFMLQASDPKQLQESYTGLSFIIGHESLVHRYTRYQEAHMIWDSLDQAGRIEAIKNWLDCEENTDSVLIFDDLDGLGDPNVIQKSLPSLGKCLVFSTRNPILPETPEFKALSISVPRLTLQESEALLRRELEGNPITDEQVYRIVEVACHHPLMMLATAHLIRHQPKFIFTALGYSTAASWLVDKVPGPLSLLQLYERSLDRLPAENQQDIIQFITAIAFISPPIGSPSQTPIIPFFQGRGRLNDQKDFNGFPNHAILSLSLMKLSSIFSEMERVSLLDDSPSNDGSYVHPIWLECARHRCTKDERIS